MKKITRLHGMYLGFLLFVSVTADAQMVMSRQARTLTTANGDTFYSYEYKPQGYNPSGTTLHPLIIFLHGIGERGNNITDLPSLENLGLPLVIKDGSPMSFNWNGKTESFVVMAPMSRETSTINTDLSRWHPQYIQATIDYAVNNLKIDTNRIYLTGLSYGGGGTFNYISLNYSNTQKIAAAAPVSSPDHFRSTGPAYVKNANLPLWAFVGALDPLTPPIHSQTAVNEINALTPAVRARLSLIPDGAHDWKTYNAVYYHLNHSNGVYENPVSLYEWFLGQDKSLTPNVLPVADAGADQTITTSPGSTVLDGSNSTDAVGIVRYLWRQVSGPKPINISNSYTSSTAAATAYKTKSISGLTTAGTYQFELTVVDVRAGFRKDTVQIEVESPTSPSGKAVTITGSLGRIATGDVTELKNATKFTLEAQFKYDASLNRWTTIMRKSTSLSDRIMLHISPDTNAIFVMVGNGSNSFGHTTANAVTPGNWYHVAAVYDGTQSGNANRLRLYINGVQKTLNFSGTTIPASTSGTNAAPFMAGGEPGCCDLNGTIDEVRVWDTALSAATIAGWKDKLLGSCHPNINNLVVYWPLDDHSSPTTAKAALGTAYAGTITNGNYVSSSQATDTTGCNQTGKAVSITASTGRIATGDVTELRNATKFTLETRFQYDSTTETWTTLMRKSNTSSSPPLSDRIMLHIRNNNSIYVMVGNGSNSYGYTGVNAVSPGVWYHVAAVFDGTQTGNANRLKLYIDGVQQTLSFDGTIIPSITSNTNTAPFMAGGETGCCYLHGAIDEVRVWNTALPVATISEWQDKQLGDCHPSIDSLVLYWPLDDDSNPSTAAPALGTAYTGTITNGNYVGSSQASASSGCGEARIALSSSLPIIKQNKGFTGKLYPNPTGGLVRMELQATTLTSVNINIIDMSGKYVYSTKRPLVKGNNSIGLNIASLPSGTYLIEVGEGKATLQRFKLLKQ